MCNWVENECLKLRPKRPVKDHGIVREGSCNRELRLKNGTRNLVRKSWNECFNRIAPCICSIEEERTSQKSICSQKFGQRARYCWFPSACWSKKPRNVSWAVWVFHPVSKAIENRNTGARMTLGGVHNINGIMSSAWDKMVFEGTCDCFPLNKHQKKFVEAIWAAGTHIREGLFLAEYQHSRIKYRPRLKHFWYCWVGNEMLALYSWWSWTIQVRGQNSVTYIMMWHVVAAIRFELWTMNTTSSDLKWKFQVEVEQHFV